MPDGGTDGGFSSQAASAAKRRQVVAAIAGISGFLLIIAGLATLIPNPWARYTNGLGYRSICPWAPTASLACMIVGGFILMYAFELYARKTGRASGGGGRADGGVSGTVFLVAGVFAAAAGFSYPYTARSMEMQKTVGNLGFQVRPDAQGPTQVPLEPDFPAAAEQGSTSGQEGAAGAADSQTQQSQGFQSTSPTKRSLMSPSASGPGELEGESETEWVQ